MSSMRNGGSAAFSLVNQRKERKGTLPSETFLRCNMSDIRRVKSSITRRLLLSIRTVNMFSEHDNGRGEVGLSLSLSCF
jgi:hypothetical protein